MPIRMTRPMQWLWVAAVGVLGALAATAAFNLAGMLSTLGRAFPGSIGSSGWLLVISALSLALAGLWLAYRLPTGWAFVLGMVVLVVGRLAAMYLIDPPLVRDPASYDRLAWGILDGHCCISNRPMGYPLLLAGAYALGLSGKVVTLAASVIAGPAIWALARRLGGPASAGVALFLWAVAPSMTMLTGVLLTEPTYAAMVLVALLALPGHDTRPGVLRSGVAGFLLGISHYVRATGIVLAPAFAIPLVLRRRWRELGAMALLIAVALSPLIAFTGGISTSPQAGWTVLVGTNAEHDGQWNEDDAVLYGSWGEEAERRARDEAIRRITTSPVRFALLAVRKTHAMWSSEGYATFFAFGGTDTPQRTRDTTRLVSQAFYVPVFLAALVALWRMRRGPPDLAWVILGILMTVAVMHIFVEVQGRYSAYTVPLMIVLAASLVGRAPWSLGQTTLQEEHET